MATTNIGFEEELWLMADKLRGSMDSSEYKHVVLTLLFNTKNCVISFSYGDIISYREGF